MNCPSRTDEDILLENPTWNQNPPAFAADLTTCQDLNGIANARELGDAECLKGGSGLTPWDGEESVAKEGEGLGGGVGKGVEGSSLEKRGPCTRTIAYVDSEHRAGWPAIDALIQQRRSLCAALGSWPAWLLSVFCTSLLISCAQQYVIPALVAWMKASSFPASTPKVSDDRNVKLVMNQPLSKRDACATGGANHNYNLPFHVGGLFIILFVSSTACAFPILVIKFPRLRIPASFLFSAKHFGTGVLIATAFVHLLPTAFLSLSNPCLSRFWTTDYPAMPGAIMLASVFFVTVIEMVFSPAQHVCGGNADGLNAVSRTTPDQTEPQDTATNAREEMRRTYSDASMRMRDLGPLQGRMTSISRTLSRMREENQRLEAIESIRSGSRSKTDLTDEDRKNEAGCAIEDSERSQPSSTFQLSPAQAHKKAVMQCFLLEMGILFHSVFIGMALSVSVGSEFVILLIAIIFHQTFEGLALGVRIATIEWPARSPQPWLMAVAYGCTTPLGQAIGIATHTLYSPDSQIGLLVVGIMNAVSAGFLVFASLVELMSEDFLSDESWQILRGKKRVFACLLVFGGAFLMSLVGAWA